MISKPTRPVALRDAAHVGPQKAQIQQHAQQVDTFDEAHVQQLHHVRRQPRALVPVQLNLCQYSATVM